MSSEKVPMKCRRDEKNLVVKAIYKGWDFLGLAKKEYPGLALRRT